MNFSVFYNERCKDEKVGLRKTIFCLEDDSLKGRRFFVGKDEFLKGRRVFEKQEKLPHGFGKIYDFSKF